MREASNELKVRFSDEDMAWLREKGRKIGFSVFDAVRYAVSCQRAREGDLTPWVENPMIRNAAPKSALPESRDKTDIEVIQDQMAELRQMVAALVQHPAVSIPPLSDYHQQVRGNFPPAPTDEPARSDIVYYPDEPPETEEIDIPADEDGGIASEEMHHILQTPIPQQSTPRRFGNGPKQHLPGSLTSPAGVNSQVGHGFKLGDPGGNLIRENFPHLGFTGGGTRGR